MTIKETAYNPLPHRHNVFDVIDLDKELYGEAGRTKAPVIDFQYSGSFGIGAATDTAAGGGFSPSVDTAAMWGGAGDTTKARVTIPVTGRYEVDWQFYVDGIGAGVCTANVLMNGTSVTSNAIASAQGAGNGWAGPHAHVSRVFNKNDILYFYMWTPVAGSVRGTWFGGSRTRGVVRYVGPT